MTATVIEKSKMAFSVDEISGQTTLSKAFLRNEIRSGNLKVKRFGRRVLVLDQDLQKYLNKEEKEDQGEQK